MNFLYKESKSKKKSFFFGEGGEGGVLGGGRTRASDFFYTKNPNLKQELFFCSFVWGG